MKKLILAVTLTGLFGAAPLAACDMPDHAKTDTKAELKTSRKAKVAKAHKAVKPVAEAQNKDQKI
jgi:hypothetical protein